MRPKPRLLPRGKIDQDFAVLLMRTSYQVADELDFMPMDEFQKDFFLLRQREWDVYREQLPVTQGDLTDASYFDFISFTQYATIAEGMRAGRMNFQELIDSNGTTVMVTRAPPLPSDNAALPALHSERVGQVILDWICERYQKTAPPILARPTAVDLRAGVTALLKVFQANEYMLLSTVEPLAHGLELNLVAPATLWSGQCLRLRGDFPNDFEAKAVQAYLRACGVPATYTTRIEQKSTVVHSFTWPDFLDL